jgi:hypothetical protein
MSEDLLKWRTESYKNTMADIVKFVGKVVRAEPGGFGIVEFDQPIGPRSNTHGIISVSSGTTIGLSTPLAAETRVAGIAVVDERELASVTTVTEDHE